MELVFWHLVRLEDMSSDTWFDGAMVQVSGDGGDSWDEVEPSDDYQGPIEPNFSECDSEADFDGQDGWSGYSADWEQVTVALDADVLTDQFRVRFWSISDRSATDEGWTVDDVSLQE